MRVSLTRFSASAPHIVHSTLGDMSSQPSTSKLNRLPSASTSLPSTKTPLNARLSRTPSRNPPESGPSQPTESKLHRLPPAANLTPSAMKRRIQDKSRALPSSKRQRQDDLSTSFTHVIPGVINFSHSIWGPSQREGGKPVEVSVPAQFRVKKANVPQHAKDSVCSCSNDVEIGEGEVDSTEASMGNEPNDTEQEKEKNSRHQVKANSHYAAHNLF